MENDGIFSFFLFFEKNDESECKILIHRNRSKTETVQLFMEMKTR